MTLTLAPETEIRLRTVAEGRRLEPAELHEDLLQEVLAEAEIELNETMVGLDESAEAMAAGRWITLKALGERLSAYAKGVRDSRTKSGQP